MSYILRSERWRRQPTVPVEVDENNPLAAGLTFAAIPGIPGGYSTYPRLSITQSTARGSIGTTRGLALTQDGTVLGETASWSINPIGSNQSNYSILAVAAAPSEARRAWAGNVGDESAGDNQQCGIFLNATVGGTDAGKFSFWEYTGAYHVSADSGSTGHVDGAPHVYMGVRNGSSPLVYWDGTDVTTNAASGGATAPFATSVACIGSNHTGVARGVKAQLLLLIWLRSLGAHEARELGENPWQVFRPQARRIYVNTAAAGGGAVTAGVLLVPNNVRGDLGLLGGYLQ